MCWSRYSCVCACVLVCTTNTYFAYSISTGTGILRADSERNAASRAMATGRCRMRATGRCGSWRSSGRWWSWCGCVAANDGSAAASGAPTPSVLSSVLHDTSSVASVGLTSTATAATGVAPGYRSQR